MKKFVFVIPPKDFRDVELFEPKKILEKNGIEVEIASIRLGQAIGVDGAKIQIDREVIDIESDEFDGIAFIGGNGTVPLVDDEIFKDLARQFYHAKKIIAAICVAPAILANAGILNGKKATSTAWVEAQRILVDKGAQWENRQVVVDGNIITANGPAAATEFGQKIIELLNKDESS